MNLRDQVIAESHRLMLEALRQREQEIIRFLVVLGPALAGIIWLLNSYTTSKIYEVTFTVGIVGVNSALLIGGAYCIALGYNYRYVLYVKTLLEKEANIDNIMPKAWPKSKEQLIGKLYKRICKKHWGPFCYPPEIIKIFWIAFLFVIIGIMPITLIINQSGFSRLLELASGVMAVIMGGCLIPKYYGKKLLYLYEKQK